MLDIRGYWNRNLIIARKWMLTQIMYAIVLNVLCIIMMQVVSGACDEPMATEETFWQEEKIR